MQVRKINTLLAFDLMSFPPQGGNGKALPLATRVQPPSRWAFTTLVLMACLGSVLVAGMTIACLRHYAHRLAAKKLGLGPEAGGFSHQEYQVRGTDRKERMSTFAAVGARDQSKE